MHSEISIRDISTRDDSKDVKAFVDNLVEQLGYIKAKAILLKQYGIDIYVTLKD